MRAPRPPTAMPPSRAAVLTAVLTLPRPTVRDVAALAGLSISVTHHHLVELRQQGLVAWETGKAGTLRPTAALSWPSPTPVPETVTVSWLSADTGTTAS